MTARAGSAVRSPASAHGRDKDTLPTVSAEWLPMRAAIALLGVSSPTLRRWADAGRITTWTTPGGHRRFERSGLIRLLAHGHRQGRTADTAARGDGRVAREPSTASEAQARSLPTAVDRRLAGPVRSLLAALVGCLQADSARRPAAISAAEAEAVGVGVAARSAGIPAGDVAAVIHGVRLQILEVLASSARIRGLPADELSGLLVEAVAILDPVLDVSLMDELPTRAAATSIPSVPYRS